MHDTNLAINTWYHMGMTLDGPNGDMKLYVSDSSFESAPVTHGGEGRGTFDSSKMSEMMGYGKSDDMKRDMVAVDTIKKAGRSLEQVPDHVTNALTRDYSGLMKAIDKKKGK